MANVKKKRINLRKELQEHFCNPEIEEEQTYLGPDWWYIPTLLKFMETNHVLEMDLDLASVDLGVMPWRCKSMLQFIQHSIDVESVDFKYPVILSPGGWVMNGWHRVVKAILMGKQTIKAVRMLELPKPDGTDTPAEIEE